MESKADRVRLSATYADDIAKDIEDMTWGDVWSGDALMREVYKEDWPTLVKYINAEITAAKRARDAFEQYIDRLCVLRETIEVSEGKESA